MTGLEASAWWVYLVAAVAVFAFGVVKLAFVPLAVWFEVRRRDADGPDGPRHARPSGAHRASRRAGQFFVSVIVPAYNEAVVLRACVESILTTRHTPLEVIIVDDGSTDGTAAVMRELAAEHENVYAVGQPNAGKGAALNRGIGMARGDVLLFADADGIFGPTTIPWLLTGLADPRVGAVCGDDRPVNLDRIQTRLLSVISHVGTGLVRRAFSLLHCLPIVSGNIGVFRADLVRAMGGFRTDTVGEDLELTWRVYQAGYRVTFEPRAIVLAESPSTVGSLWRQRVRWARGLLQTVHHHRGMIGNPSYGVFGVFLAFNAITMILVPVLQLAALALLVVLLPAGRVRIEPTVLGIVGWLGLAVTVAMVVVGIALNRAWRDLEHLWTVPLWPIYSLFVGASMIAAILKESRGGPAPWNKLPRTGVVSAAALASAHGRDAA